MIFYNPNSFDIFSKENIEKVLSFRGHQNKTQTSKIFAGINQALVVYPKKKYYEFPREIILH